MERLILDIDLSSPHHTEDQMSEPSIYFSSINSVINPRALTQHLENRAFEHAITRIDPTNYIDPHSTNSFSFLTSSRYAKDLFYGIVIDTGASRNSTAGYNQYQALCNIAYTPINTSTAGTVKVQFGIGCAASIGSIILKTPIGEIEFHFVKADTPFLLSLSDMDKLGIYYNNVQNILVS